MHNKKNNSVQEASGKILLKKMLQHLGMLNFFYRGRERTLAARTAGNENQAAADGLPVPPAVLRMRVAGTADFDWFLTGGAKAAAGIRDVLARHGTSPEQTGGMLDFGCGCGRVIRQWAGIAGVHGCDLNDEAISWCRDNLPFARFAANKLRPPLVYSDETFSFVYALSVFTHLPEDEQGAWMHELRRVLKPGGLLLITTHGTGFLDHLSDSERLRYQAGDLIVHWQAMAGSNMCSAFHPESYVRGPFSTGFDLLEFRPTEAPGNPPQDLVLLKKPMHE